MAKARTADSIEDAIMRACGELGTKRVADAIGKTDGWVRSISDPDNERKANIFQCIAIDTAMVEAGFEPPILGVYQRKIEAVEAGHTAKPVLERYTRAVSAIGDVGNAIEAANDPHGPAGEHWTNAEYSELCRAFDEAENTLAQMRRDARAKMSAQTVRPVEVRRA